MSFSLFFHSYLFPQSCFSPSVDFRTSVLTAFEEGGTNGYQNPIAIPKQRYGRI